MNEKNHVIEEEKQLPHLLILLNNTLARYGEAISRYSIMNNYLTGTRPECAVNVEESGENIGIIGEIIRKSEDLSDLCAQLDTENNRLNKIISDG